MNTYSIISAVIGLLGAAIYFGAIYFAGRRGWWWLALLVSLPAIMALVSFSRMPAGFGSQSSSFLIRHFVAIGIAQLIAGAATYFLARSLGPSKTSK